MEVPHSIAGIRSAQALWGEIFQLALQALRANKLRSILTMLGVVIGSASIVMVVTVALAGKHYIVAQVEGMGANLVYANIVHTGEAGSMDMSDQISPGDLQAVKAALPRVVVEAAGSSVLTLTMDVDGRERLINLVGVTENFEKIRNLQILRGRYFDEDDLNSRAKVCLLTQDLARRMFPYQDPLGRTVRVGELSFTAIGVFRERIATLGETEITRDSAIVPFSLMRDYTGGDYLKTLYVRADGPDDVPLVTQQVHEILQSRHRPGANYRVQNLTGILATARNIALGLTVVLILIALIALTIGGIGIMNIMLVTVTERTREIGIRRAIGASRDAIRYQFLMEATVISGAGALAGILIAIAIPALLNVLIGFLPDIGDVRVPVSWVSVALAFVVSCSTGLIFGYLPANRAAGLQPTKALHYE